jgi:hypothetical protein
MTEFVGVSWTSDSEDRTSGEVPAVGGLPMCILITSFCLQLRRPRIRLTSGIRLGPFAIGSPSARGQIGVHIVTRLWTMPQTSRVSAAA